MSALRLTLRGLAMVPIVTGTLSLALGSHIIDGGSETHPNVESELRFYATWWIGLGIYLLSLAPRIEERGRELRIVCALLVLGAAGRAIGIADAGRPDTTYLVLMATEFLLPAILVPWQARVQRDSAGK